MRQDPDVLLVGEIRDEETAEIATHAALTGHLVLSTLHTNDAPSTITRMVDMGIEPFNVASAVNLITAQRLVRRICKKCKEPVEYPPEYLQAAGFTAEEAKDVVFYRGKGCDECGGTGYRGRIGVFEVLPVTAALRQVLLSTPTEAAIGAAARANGMMTLRASALAAAHRGETTYEEVLRATTVDTVSGQRCPSCSRALADDMVCCPYDGTPVNRGRCAGCDKHLDVEWRVCPFCRTAVERTPLAVAEERLPRLLVVDDDASVGAFVKTALTGSADVITALDAEEGLALVGSEEVDAVLIDNGLPDLSGVELIRLLRTDPRTVSTPIVLFTGVDSADVERSARRAGADDYLAKPMEPLLLEERVLGLIRDGRRRAA